MLLKLVETVETADSVAVPEHRVPVEDVKVASQLLRLAVETSPDAMILARADGAISFANRQAARLFGYEPEELLDLTIEDLVPSGQRKKHARHRESYLANPAVRPMGATTDPVVELRGLRKDGTEFPADVSLGYLETEEGLTAAAAVRDVSERKRSEEAQVLTDYLDTILLNLPVGVAILEGPDFRYFRINKTLADLNGLTIEDHLGKPLAEVLPDARNILANLRKVSTEGKPILNREFSVRLPSDPDEEVHLIDFHFPISVAGQVRAVGAVVLDVTARKRAEMELRKAHDELERRVAERTAEIGRLKEKAEAENVYLRQHVKPRHRHEEIVGESEAMRKVFAAAEQVAVTDSTVLVLGETGTGKELLARWIHRLSPRRKGLMVEVNCAGLPATLVESELFGRDKGAYTGALTAQKGRFELADRSTIFLDEVAELPLELQGKLLRVLQEGRFERLGNPRTIQVDVRVIAATNRNLRKEVREGRFREDLYYRLNVFPITMPPLRERRGDVRLLVWAFIEELAKTMGKSIDTIPRKSLAALETYGWPGNVRELRNIIERAMILSSGSTLEVELASGSAASSGEEMTFEEAQRRHLRAALERAGWRVRGEGGAAEALALKPTTLETKMRKLGIRRPG